MEMFENEYSKMWINNGILYVKYAPLLVITGKIAQEGVIDRLKFCKGKTYPLLGDIRYIKDVSKEARAYLATGDSAKGLSAGGLIIKTQIEKFLGNLWMKIDKPIKPIKLFTDEASALQWLQHYKNVN